MPENRKSYIIFILGLFEKISYTVLILGAKTQCCLLLIQWFEISSGRAGCAEFCFLTSKQFANYIWISRKFCTRKNSEGEEKMAWLRDTEQRDSVAVWCRETCHLKEVCVSLGTVGHKDGESFSTYTHPFYREKKISILFVSIPFWQIPCRSEQLFSFSSSKIF